MFDSRDSGQPSPLERAATVVDLRYPRIAGAPDAGAEAGIAHVAQLGGGGVALTFTAADLTNDPSPSHRLIRNGESIALAGNIRAMRPVPAAGGWVRPLTSEANVVVVQRFGKVGIEAEVFGAFGASNKYSGDEAKQLPVVELASDLVETGKLAEVSTVRLRGMDGDARVALAELGLDVDFPMVSARLFLTALTYELRSLDRASLGTSRVMWHAANLVGAQLDAQFAPDKPGTFAPSHSVGRLDLLAGSNGLDATMALSHSKPSEWVKLAIDPLDSMPTDLSGEDKFQLAELAPALSELGRRTMRRVDLTVISRN
jgi:hypothetical protein